MAVLRPSPGRPAGCMRYSGPSEAEFLAACLNEGERRANKDYATRMGVKGDAFCNVRRRKQELLSADAQQAMILDMQGKKQEAHAIGKR